MSLIGNVQAMWTWPAIGMLVMIFQPLEYCLLARAA